MDQIQEKKTTKSTIHNMSKNYSFIPWLSHEFEISRGLYI